MKESEIQIGHYPFEANEKPTIVHLHFARQMDELLQTEPFKGKDAAKLFNSFSNYFVFAEQLFTAEDEARRNNVDGANLYYHNREHAVYQATFDAITTTKAVLSRQDSLSSYLTAEGVTAIFVGAAFHDTGYVYEVGVGDNFAARTPIHVEESERALRETIAKIKLPSFINEAKVTEFAAMAIAATKFPYTNEQEEIAKQKLAPLDPKERKEANIVRLIVRFADLGGQTARKDYFMVHIKNLREEINTMSPDLGTSIIGIDEEMDTKCREFIENVVYPTVGKTANAFFTKENPYTIEWQRQGK